MAHFWDWPNAIALAPEAAANAALLELRSAVLHKSGERIAAKADHKKDMHISLFRPRGYDSQAVKREFGCVLAACRDTPLGSVRIVRLALKREGSEHSYDSARVLWVNA